MLTLRCLLALKGVCEMHVWQSSMMVGATYRNVKHGAHQGGVECEEGKSLVVPVTEESLLRTVKAQAMPWRLTVDGTRAVLDLLIVGVGYLL